MKRFVKFGLILVFVIFFCTGLIFLPEYVAKREDVQYMNQFVLYARDTSTDNLVTLSLDEKLNILSQVDGDKNDNQVLSIYTYENLKKSDKNLLNNLDKNIKKLENMDIIPVISDGMSWRSSFSYGELCNLSLSEKPGSVLSVWKLEFNEYKDYGRCFFVLDADTYQIYEAVITGWRADEYLNKINMQFEREELDLYSWGNHWMERYGSYLAEDAIIDSGFYIAVNDMDICGYLEVGEITYFMETGIAKPGDYTEKGIYDTNEMYNTNEYYSTFYFHFSATMNEKTESTT